MKLYRAMRADSDGMPAVGPTARTLGVRGLEAAPFEDVPALQPTDVVPPRVGGMSVTPNDPIYLPPLRLPMSMGGKGKDPIWQIDTADIGPDLLFRQDSTTHGLLEPVRPMTRGGLQSALEATRPKWIRYIG
jgi:hypothetical protein